MRPLLWRVINEVGHAWGVRMGTRLQYDLCSHVYSHYPSTAKGSLLPPLWLKYHCRSPEKTIANAEAVHLLLSLWLRTDHSCINKEHIHIGENLRFTHHFIFTSGEAPDSISPLLQAVAVFRQQDLEQHLCSSRRCVYHEGCSRISAKPKLS